jgi:hypothetical protein
MSTLAQQHDDERHAGTFVFAPEEEEEMIEIIAETEAADREGKLIPIEDVLAKLGRSPCAR